MNGHKMSEDHVNAPEVENFGKFYQTSTGIGLTLLGVSPMLIAKLHTIGADPEIPTRKMVLDFDTPDGEEPAVQEEPLSEDDLQDDEERKRWAEYIKAKNAVDSKRNDAFVKAIFAKGVKVDLTRLDQWKEEMEYFGVEIPTHPLDLKVQYIQTEAVGNAQDMVEIITGVLSQSGVQDEDLKEVKSMFQGAVRRSTPGETIDAEGQVAVEPDIYGDGGYPLLGDMASESVL